MSAPTNDTPSLRAAEATGGPAQPALAPAPDEPPPVSPSTAHQPAEHAARPPEASHHGGQGQAPGGSEPLRLSLRCLRCHHTDEYDVRSAYIDPEAIEKKSDWDGIVLGRIVTCQRCGAQDDYELTPIAHMNILGLTMRAVMRKKQGTSSGQDTVQIIKLKLRDGTQTRRPTQALAHLQKLAEASPQSGEAWRRLGNLREKFEQIDGAIDAWRLAVERDETEAEACYSLAYALADRGEHDEATRYVAQLVARQARQRGDWPLRAEMLVRALSLATAHAERQKRPLGLRVWLVGAPENPGTIDLHAVPHEQALLALFEGSRVAAAALTDEVNPGDLGPLPRLNLLAGWAPKQGTVRSGPRVGRNDPCPCGSGKKYKKCCAR